MNSPSLFRGVIWTIVGLLFAGHLLGGWFYSDRIIDQGFTPDPDVIITPTGDFDLEEVTYVSDLGTFDAYYLPAESTTWVIHVHGLGATPAEAENLFAPLQQAGYQQMAITYRNDENQPMDPTGFYQYGVTEYVDIQGAMDFAHENGAQSIVFSGFSTGASHVLSFTYRNNIDDIKGLIFDSPNIDLGDTVDFRGGMEELPILPLNVPPTLTWVAKFFTSLRIDMNWKTIDYIDKTESSLRVPVLVHHGIEDESVPVSQSEAFQDENPDLIRLIQVPDAGHVGSYEADPEQYVEEVLRFLAQLGV